MKPKYPLPIPVGLERPFGCVRPLIFYNPEIPFPSVPGTGFLLSLFGQIFFITTRHAIKNAKQDVENLVVFYNETTLLRIPLEESREYSSIDPSDTDHVDIVVVKVDMGKVDLSLFTNGVPFAVSYSTAVTNYYDKMPMHFIGLAPDRNEFDYEAGQYKLHYAAMNTIYMGPSNYRTIHISKAIAVEECPDFDGMSGSPLFYVDSPNDPNSKSRFGGMAIRGSRSSSIVRFMEAKQVITFMIEFFVSGLEKADAELRLMHLTKRFMAE